MSRNESVGARSGASRPNEGEREIVVSRMIEGTRERVFEAYTEVRHLSRWWGPNGFTTTTRSFEFRPGGAWDFIMHGPDGTDYPNRVEWREIVPPERIALWLGDREGDPHGFTSEITFEKEGKGRTRVTMRSLFQTKADRDRAVEVYHAIEGGRETLGRLAELVEGATAQNGGARGGRVFFSVGMTLDGFLAPAERPDDPEGKRWMAQWMKLHSWVFAQRFFRENLKFGDGGETGRDNEILEETFRRTGASILGKRMFAKGEHSWPEEAPFRTPVFVLTHERRAPWVRPGGTTFHFVNDGIESALRQAHAAAGGRDVRIAGGADVIVQYLNAGLVDEFSVALAPVMFGSGTPLFDRVDPGVAIELVQTIPSERVTHLRYAMSPVNPTSPPR